jgi:ABC-type taurine transport system ATPase subunit
LEAFVATLSSSRFYDLIERVFGIRRQAPRAIFDIVRVEYPAVRALARAERPTSETVDDAWLHRQELRGPSEAIRMLESGGFRDGPGMTRALLVDDRCGLIREHLIGPTSAIDPQETVARLLRLASECHASGILLATHDLGGANVRSERCRSFTMNLRRKGEAIEIFLLDHVVLMEQGWKRFFAAEEAARL